MERPATLLTDPASNIINLIDTSFINIGRETSKGIDMVARLRATVAEPDDNPLDLTWSGGITYQIDRKRQIFQNSPIVDNVGRMGNPKWKFRSPLSLEWKRFKFLWQARFIGQTQFAEDLIDPERPFCVNPECNTMIPTRADVTANRRLYNDASVSVNFDRFALRVGIDNLTDTKPPLISAFSGPNPNNAVTFSGCDLFGRTWFLEGRVRF